MKKSKVASGSKKQVAAKKKSKKAESSLSDVMKIVKRKTQKLNKKYPALEVKNYTKKFGDFTSVNKASFKVKQGVIHGFIGPNGSGKTTTIKAMIGAYIPTSGDIFINNQKARTKNANNLIGYIPERASFPKHLNTIKYLTSMGQLSGLKKRDAKKKSRKIIEALGLKIHAKRKPTGFSSGMQKKILLAQALLTDPSILILDEPAANLDPTARKELFDQLIELRKQGKTILISSHILSELERLINEVTFIYYGKIIYSGNLKLAQNNDISDTFIRSNKNKELMKMLKD